MNEQELDTLYTAMSETIGRIDPDKLHVFLSMLALSLLARHDSLDGAMQLLQQAEAQAAL